MYAGGNSNDPNLTKRIKEVQAKEARIAALEKELDDFESGIKADSKGVRLEKNWPCKSYAFARNDIGLDIPVRFQKAVKKFYSLWWLTVFCTIMNWICIVWWAGLGTYDTGFQDYLFSSLYIVVGVPLSWMLLYKRYYKAMIAHGALGSVFFLFLFAHLIWVVLMAIGFELMDAAGWLVMTKVFIDGHSG
eukprot:839486_1